VRIGIFARRDALPLVATGTLGRFGLPGVRFGLAVRSARGVGVGVDCFAPPHAAKVNTSNSHARAIAFTLEIKGPGPFRLVRVNVSSRFAVAGFGVVVTGGASGLGLAYGEVLAAHGARVTLIDVDADAVDAHAERLRQAGGDVRGAVADVTNHATLDRVIDAAAAHYGRLDVAFANAGVDPGPGPLGAWAGAARPRVPEGALENYSDERWNRVIDINLNGIFATARAAARHLRPRKWGRIIFTTSLAATAVEPAIGAAYMTAKAGARHLMHTLALELAADGITVNAIAPGFFVTNIGGGHAHNPDVQAAVANEIPMHRVGHPDDLKPLALFLASHASDYITGQEIIIDGGWGLGRAD
jgi:NAD(P)-dependent dehydrogenase (short-subunit alcohol dehydrogenase family)